MKRYWGPYYARIAEALAQEDEVVHGSDAGLLVPSLVIQ